MSQEDYDNKKKEVAAAATKRLSLLNDDGNPINHNSICECIGCKEERVLREELSAMPEHSVAQREWFSFMKELHSATYREAPVTEFDMFADVVC